MSTMTKPNTAKTRVRLPDESRETFSETRREDVLDLPIGLIDPHPDNPRENWDEQELKSMARSVKQAGIIQPLVVRRRGDRYQLVAGERRLRAAQMANRPTVPAVVREIGDAESRSIMIHENLERKGLNAIEKAKLLAKVCAPLEEGGDGLNHTEASKIFGRGREWVSNLVRLLRLPEAWQRRIVSGELPERQARRLVVHVESPEVLDAVERDMEVNPWAWKTDEDFERSLGLIVANPSVAGNPQTPADKPRAPRAPAVAGAVANDTTTAALRKGGSAPLEEAAETDEAEEICAAIGRICDLEQLDMIQAAIEDRRAELRA